MSSIPLQLYAFSDAELAAMLQAQEEHDTGAGAGATASDTISDEALALALSASLCLDQGAGAGAGADALDTSNDEALALELARGYTQRVHAPMPPEIENLYTKFKRDMDTKVRDDMDVHAFNAAVAVKIRLPILLTHDASSVANNDFSATRALLEASETYKTYDKQPVLQSNLTRLGAHIVASKTEAETGANAEELFSRTWSLAAPREDYTKELFRIICENSEAGGGCYAGFAGRLARLYIIMLRDQWR